MIKRAFFFNFPCTILIILRSFDFMRSIFFSCVCLRVKQKFVTDSNKQSACVDSSDILNELLQRENRVLHFWTMRKRRLDQCQQYVVFERSAKQVCACLYVLWE